MEKFARFKVFFFIILSFWGVSIVNAKSIQPAEYLKYVSEVTQQFEKEMKNEYGLLCIGSGGSMPHDVEKIEIHLLSYQKGTIDKARELEVKATEKLTNLINENKKLKPFLREHPFPSNRTVISLAFYDKNNQYYNDGSVSYVFHVRKKIFYRAVDSKTGNFIPLTEEPYEEALRKVQKGQ